MNVPATPLGNVKGRKTVPFGQVERQIARRYLGAKKSQGGVGVIAWISFTCIMLAIMAMITIMSIMNGFREQLIELTIGSEGHMYVGLSDPEPTGASIDEMVRKINEIPGINKAFEFSENLSVLQTNNEFSPGRVIGIRPEELRNFELIASNVQFGSLDGFGQGTGAAHEIAIGVHLANQLRLQAGDRVRILTKRTRSTAIGTPQLISKIYTIGAIFEVGLYQTDSSYIYMDLDQSQLLYSDGRKSGEIQIRLDNADMIDNMMAPIRGLSDKPIWVQTWRDRNSTIATALRTEQLAMRMIFVLVVVISTFPILAAMIMLVKNKAKDIAILRTIGGTRGSILRIFFIAGSTIGFLGTLAGLIFGVLFCLNIGLVQAIIEGVTGTELFPPDVYQLSAGIPAKIVWGEVFAVALCGFIISAIATFFPALSAANTDPVDALRYE